MASEPHVYRKRRFETPYEFRKRLEQDALRDIRPHPKPDRPPVRRARRKRE